MWFITFWPLFWPGEKFMSFSNTVQGQLCDVHVIIYTAFSHQIFAHMTESDVSHLKLLLTGDQHYDCLSPQHVESEDKYLSAPLPSLTSSHSDLLQSVTLLNIHSLHHSPQRFHGLP